MERLGPSEYCRHRLDACTDYVVVGVLCVCMCVGGGGGVCKCVELGVYMCVWGREG